MCAPGGVQAEDGSSGNVSASARRAFMVEMNMFNWMWNLFALSQETSSLHLSMEVKEAILDSKINFNYIIFGITIGNSFCIFPPFLLNLLG